MSRLIMVAVAALCFAGRADAEEDKGDSGCIQASDAPVRDQRFAAQLSEAGRKAIRARFPHGRIVDACAASFSAKDAKEFGLTLLDSDDPDAPVQHIHQLIVLADGSVIEIPWTESKHWRTADNTENCEPPAGAIWVSQRKCVKPEAVKKFLKDFLPGFVSNKSAFRDKALRQQSYCFSFDNAYNNWQCYVYDAKTKKFVLWGYQSAAD